MPLRRAAEDFERKPVKKRMGYKVPPFHPDDPWYTYRPRLGVMVGNGPPAKAVRKWHFRINLQMYIVEAWDVKECCNGFAQLSESPGRNFRQLLFFPVKIFLNFLQYLPKLRTPPSPPPPTYLHNNELVEQIIQKTKLITPIPN